uniref:Uncharacterized protein n=1 Tax=Arundo donax TaxID=35708 RepID=A0A0A9BB69_ARUDO
MMENCNEQSVELIYIAS